jgi:predicted PurR-regulated permease PerM
MLEPLRPEPSEEERPRPNLKNLIAALEGPFGVRSLAITGLFILAAFYTLYLARAFFLPIILALLLNFLLSPVVRVLKKIHIPEPVSAALLVFGLLGALGFGIYELAGPAYEWAYQAPKSLQKLEGKLANFKKPVQTMSRATQQVEQITTVGAGQKTPAVEVQQESLGQKLFSRTTEILAAGSVLIILLFFLLASGDMFLRKLISVLPSLEDKKTAVEIARQIESDISTYLATITMINACLGLATWGAMALLKVPNPLLWGVLAWATNYIPYLGAMTMYAVLTMVGFLTFPTAGHALLVPGAFGVLNILEAYLLTPMMLGRRLTLNPVVIFLALTFWGWLWGVAGAILAVPIMVVFKIFCDHSEPLAPIGEFLGD